MNRSNLKPCPFCGSTDICGYLQTEEFVFYVMCEKCESMTGVYKTEDEAWMAWNRRAEVKDRHD